MNTETPQAIHLKDYRPPNFKLPKTHLKFQLFEDHTLVHSVINVERNGHHSEPLVLDGCELELKSIAINGIALEPSCYCEGPECLTLFDVPDQFSLEVVTKIYPQSNTSLEGLYRSRTMYCTQCEAEGFRKITYFLDRPDVLSVYTVSIEADSSTFPVLLSNGNCMDRIQLDEGRHRAIWYDPFPKPSYLFALVAGNLACVEGEFVTQSNRKVAIEIYVEEKDVNKCEHAMNSLKEAMRWDEETYGREYDLDIYMIVAVDDFNMGAMENKGLNIFNTSCVLASPETTTDDGYQRVEGVIAHEYFHNWSGNRVTCRDWFQLSLKEGFTVFRDEEFSADMGSRTVKRVEDVQLLRSLQFAEDAGPMAHPVRPESYIEISNFYTLTVYEKGAEVVRMIRTLIGDEAFRKGSDLYFEKNDGRAATIEDFIDAMTEVSAYDFTPFMTWYRQAGTPLLSVTGLFDEAAQTYTLNFKQTCASTPEMSATDKLPFVIPVVMGLVGQQANLTLHSNAPEFQSRGATEGVVTLHSAEHSVVFSGVSERPVPALLRGFSAPVKLDVQYTEADLLRLLSTEEDGFCKWDASEKLAIHSIGQIREGMPVDAHLPLIQGFKNLLSQSQVDPAMIALILQLPGENYLSDNLAVADVDGVHAARKALRGQIALALRPMLWSTYTSLSEALQSMTGFTARVIAMRSLKNVCLDYLMLLDDAEIIKACWHQFESSKVMSDVHVAFRCLVHSENSTISGLREEAISRFYQQWSAEPLVMNQWFGVQASCPTASALNEVEKLLQHPAYDGNNPNKIRSVVGVFCNQNPVNFHRIDGKGYDFLKQQIIGLNDKNPQIAARLVTPLSRWKRFDKRRQDMMHAALTEILAHPGLSKDVFEMASKSLKSAD